MTECVSGDLSKVYAYFSTADSGDRFHQFPWYAGTRTGWMDVIDLSHTLPSFLDTIKLSSSVWLKPFISGIYCSTNAKANSETAIWEYRISIFSLRGINDHCLNWLIPRFLFNLFFWKALVFLLHNEHYKNISTNWYSRILKLHFLSTFHYSLSQQSVTNVTGTQKQPRDLRETCLLWRFASFSSGWWTHRSGQSDSRPGCM